VPYCLQLACVEILTVIYFKDFRDYSQLWIYALYDVGDIIVNGVCISGQLAAVDSVKLPWAEEIECGWTAAVVRDDLLALRDFLKQGMEVKVIEEMVHNAHLQLAEFTRIFSMKNVLHVYPYHIQNTVYLIYVHKYLIKYNIVFIQPVS